MPHSKLANSVNGCLAKLMIRRTHRTLLVEGDSDRDIVSALTIRKPPNPGFLPVLIDSADIIKGSGVGNRQLVEAVHAAALAQGAANYACLVDREFRRFYCDPPCRDELSDHVVQDNVLFWTRGHSVENYLFLVETAIRLLEIQFAKYLPQHYRAVVEGGYFAILVQAAAFSLAAYSSGLIQRSEGIVSLTHWSTDSAGQPFLDVNQMAIVLTARAATPAAVDQFVTAFAAHRTAATSYPPALLRWITHGHLGTEVVWTGIGFLLSSHIADKNALDGICRGYNDLKANIGADLWSLRCLANSPDETPTHLLEWIAGK